MQKIAIIGGSGIDDPKILENMQRIKKHTSYGPTSDLITTGVLGGIPCVVIPRHGDNHRINPSNVNFRANIWALKELGVTHILAPTACGSLQERIKPGHLIFIDQFIDRTTKRHQTFYEGHEVCHIPMAEPFCPSLRSLLVQRADSLKLEHHAAGTMVTIEGPRFSTKSESRMFRLWGGDVINMTTVPEAVLAREAGICYQPIAMSTDYDCWHESQEPVTLEMVLATMKANAKNVRNLLVDVIPRIQDVPCPCRDAIKTSVM
ncbi:S-methyl-5'-thioadenosine phosphorylase [Candidatus Woesearchaeota archaeon]|nr:S-methyl-5'-thioadenosine phosphorylase [Candidatus Woesearchaeota archaeon]